MIHFFIILLTVSIHFGQNESTIFKIKSAKIVAPSLTGMQRNHTVRADSVFMKRLVIHSKKHGKHTVLYDDEDHERISKRHWYLSLHTKILYCASHINTKKGKRILLMHRMIMNNPRCLIDHRNRNGLDNRKENLRKCNHSKNLANQKLSIKNTSGYKGVFYFKRVNKFVAAIKVNQIPHNLGYFETPRKAAKAYNKAAKKYFGEFARLNKV